MENVFNISLDILILILCAFSIALTVILVIKTIEDYKEDKEYYKLRNQELIKMYEFLRQQILEVKNKSINQENK